MSNSIIAYRNPLEQWAWESGAAPIFLGAFGVVLIVFFVSAIYIEWYSSRPKKFRR